MEEKERFIKDCPDLIEEPTDDDLNEVREDITGDEVCDDWIDEDEDEDDFDDVIEDYYEDDIVEEDDR